MKLWCFYLNGCQSSPASILATTTAVPPQPTPTVDTRAFAANQALGRGVNLGNALEAPSEGAWGLYLPERYFAIYTLHSRQWKEPFLRALTPEG